MPTYQYFCKDCKHKFEIEATLQEKESCCNPKFVCPKCTSKNIQQKFSLGTFFKKESACGCKGECK